ncbi:MAG: ComF family protein [Sphingomonadales bacterium]|nr:ComF family protein [Sphingomonadales bacterium]
MRPAEALAPLIDLVFPPRCPVCGEAVAGSAGLCPRCWQGLVIPGAPACVTCGRPFQGVSATGLRCAPCLADPPRHDGIVAATLYNAVSRRLIVGFKHHGRIGLAPLLARLILARLPGVIPEGLDESWLIVPVPLHRWRLWRRGFNQSVLLGREIARASGAGLVVDGLLRRKATVSLGGLGVAARARALVGAIAINPRRKARLAGARVLLVDDVVTSGATSGACVSALRRAGAAKVVIACAARVLDEALPENRDPAG